jgi:hypothetical protein
MIYNAFKKFALALTIASFAIIGAANAAKKTYSEGEFVVNFSGKSKKAVIAKLGKPAKTRLPVKPSNADAVIGKELNKDKKSVDKLEMWYYKGLVRYDAKHTYKEIELTFVNGQVRNIAFFNNR